MIRFNHRNIPELKLSDYIPSTRFRTILPELREIPHGIREISVIIEFSKDSTFFKTVLPSFYSGMMYIYGYVHDNDRLREIFQGEMAEEYSNRHIGLFDWQEEFLLVFENGSKTCDKRYIVSVEEVWNLLRSCYHPTGV